MALERIDETKSWESSTSGVEVHRLIRQIFSILQQKENIIFLMREYRNPDKLSNQQIINVCTTLQAFMFDLVYEGVPQIPLIEDEETYKLLKTIDIGHIISVLLTLSSVGVENINTYKVLMESTLYLYNAAIASSVDRATTPEKEVAKVVPTKGASKDAPKCPKCSGQMFKRTNKVNGTQFWGCEGYHSGKCNGIVNIEDTSEKATKEDIAKLSAPVPAEEDPF